MVRHRHGADILRLKEDRGLGHHRLEHPLRLLIPRPEGFIREHQQGVIVVRVETPNQVAAVRDVFEVLAEESAKLERKRALARSLSPRNTSATPGLSPGRCTTSAIQARSVPKDGLIPTPRSPPRCAARTASNPPAVVPQQNRARGYSTPRRQMRLDQRLSR